MRDMLMFSDILRRYRDPILAKKTLLKIHEYAGEIDRKILLMHVCGLMNGP